METLLYTIIAMPSPSPILTLSYWTAHCFDSFFLADRTNGRAIGTVLRQSSSVCRRRL